MSLERSAKSSALPAAGGGPAQGRLAMAPALDAVASLSATGILRSFLAKAIENFTVFPNDETAVDTLFMGWKLGLNRSLASTSMGPGKQRDGRRRWISSSTANRSS